MLIHRDLLSADAAYAVARSEIENLALGVEEGFREVAPRGVVTMPVVVHILYRDTAHDISDDQVISQIEVLNQDFRMTNPDIDSVPEPFKPFVADARVQFELATTDPEGNETSGITKTETTHSQFSAHEETVKTGSAGGHDPWPSDRYLNIWVCELITSVAGPLLGYAEFPGCPPHLDGVVIRDLMFGTTGTASPPFDRGRTTTHEVGHWLNLHHLWGDDGNGCQVSDFVHDTPNQLEPNYNTPSFPRVSCPDAAPNGDMFMNYMDYVDDACMCMFTAGQVARMDATLAGPRSSFVTNG